MKNEIKLIKEILEYHIEDCAGDYECKCHSHYPIGGCLKCDLEKMYKLIKTMEAEDRQNDERRN